MANKATKTKVTPSTVSESFSTPIGDIQFADILGFSPSELPSPYQARVTYLLTYGTRKTLQDSVSGRAKELKAANVGDSEVKSTLFGEMNARWGDVLSGDVGHGERGPRLSLLERTVRDVIELFTTGKKKKNGESYSGEDKKSLREQYIATPGKFPKVQKEVERRMEVASDSDEIEM
jgi:hypothetical protein